MNINQSPSLLPSPPQLLSRGHGVEERSQPLVSQQHILIPMQTMPGKSCGFHISLESIKGDRLEARTPQIRIWVPDAQYCAECISNKAFGKTFPISLT